jgi:hypothetical protein
MPGHPIPEQEFSSNLLSFQCAECRMSQVGHLGKGEADMKYRRLGRTTYMVSEIGFGAWGIGGAMWVGAQDDVCLRALHRAADLGLNFIDTALAYGREGEPFRDFHKRQST